RAPVLRRFVPRSLEAQFPPSLVGLGAIRVEQAGDPVVPPATGFGICDAQRILQHAAGGGLTATEPERHACFDVQLSASDRSQMFPEQAEHSLRVRCNRKLREGECAWKLHPPSSDM